MEYKEKMKHVPFGNSTFQIVNFIAKQDGDPRTYRNILLQLDAKQKAMKECYFRRKRREIDIAEINTKLNKLFINKYTKQRLLVDLEEAEYALEAEIKLIEDCVFEIRAYEKLLSELPEFTRDDFEKAESEYWKFRLFKDAERELLSAGTVSTGTLESLEKIGVIMQRDTAGRLVAFGNTPEIDKK